MMVSGSLADDDGREDLHQADGLFREIQLTTQDLAQCLGGFHAIHGGGSSTSAVLCENYGEEAGSWLGLPGEANAGRLPPLTSARHCASKSSWFNFCQAPCCARHGRPGLARLTSPVLQWPGMAVRSAPRLGIPGKRRLLITSDCRSLQKVTVAHRHHHLPNAAGLEWSERPAW